MSLIDILHLALRNLRQAKLRAVLTTMGVIVGVAVIVTMVSFGLGLQGNMLARFKALDLFSEIQRFRSQLEQHGFRGRGRPETEMASVVRDAQTPETRLPASLTMPPSPRLQDSRRLIRRALNQFHGYVRANGKVLTNRSVAQWFPTRRRAFRNLSPGR